MINGVSQPIYKIPLRDIPEVGFLGALHTLALSDKSIIGRRNIPSN